MKNKKAQEGHMWMIIGLAIALLILFLYIFFIRKPASTVEDMNSCENVGGICRPTCRADEIHNIIFKCEEPNLQCCTELET